ncbi:hypothetical protein IFR05_007135 [Cadophora sp. M221]|nr:hypothetical protein IFR05_007135 [Cadophora sp. M221]
MTIKQLRSPYRFDHYDDGSKLREASRQINGCSICTNMWAALQESAKATSLGVPFNRRNRFNKTHRSYYASEQGVLTPVRGFLNPQDLDNSDDYIFDFQMFCAPKLDLQRVEWMGPENGYGYVSAAGLLAHRGRERRPDRRSVLEGSFGITVEHASPLAALFAHKEVHDAADSDGVFQLIDSWLEKCKVSGCGWGDTDIGKLPTRIIDVGPPDGSKDPLLIVTNSSHQILSDIRDMRYIALSYCWGSETDTPFTTMTSSNLEDRKRGIPMSGLPRAFQDAVKMTRRLGVRFLWIDSLCILQGHDEDAKADWAAESSKMTEVYGGAYLTIAAASASNAHEGILVRENKPYQETRLKLQSISQPEFSHDVFIGPKPLFHQSMDEPLFRRGWTLQKRILSPRVLICNRDQFAWECQCRAETESGGHMLSIGAMRLEARSEPQAEMSLEEFTSSWQCIATDYSSRSLTHPTDKLPAIAGLARKFLEFHGGVGGRYLAGLWENSLRDDLLWGHWSIDVGAKPARCRPESYRAPTWSWASVDGNVRWPLANGNGEGPYLVDIIEVQCKQDGEDLFGCVSSGFVKLRGGSKKIDRLVVQEPDQDHGYENSAVLTIAEFGSETLRFDCTCLNMSIEEDKFEMEVLAMLSGCQEVWLLPIKESGALILGLERKDNGMKGKVFRRLGAVFDLDFLYSDNYGESGFFHGLEEEDFTIL